MPEEIKQEAEKKLVAPPGINMVILQMQMVTDSFKQIPVPENVRKTALAFVAALEDWAKVK